MTISHGLGFPGDLDFDRPAKAGPNMRHWLTFHLGPGAAAPMSISLAEIGQGRLENACRMLGVLRPKTVSLAASGAVPDQAGRALACRTLRHFRPHIPRS